MKIINYKKLLSDLEANIQEFNSKKPFRYIAIDDFLNEEFAEAILDAFPSVDEKWRDARGHYTQNKWALPNVKDKIAKEYWTEAGSKEFLDYLSKLTSIPNLIFDPTLQGAGYHQTTNEGFLNVHIDFNKLESDNTLDRRCNAIVYLNKNWLEEKGGWLEIWDMEKNKRLENICPAFNRCVIFETNEVSWHGHPKPLKVNPNESRKSLATYFYTKGRDDIPFIDSHNTLYKNTESLPGFFKTFKNGIKHFLRKIKITK